MGNGDTVTVYNHEGRPVRLHLETYDEDAHENNTEGQDETRERHRNYLKRFRALMRKRKAKR